MGVCAPAGSSTNGGGNGSVAAVFDADDLLPRADISGDINADLLGRLANTNWKDRKAALDDVDRLVTSAGGRVAPQV